MVYSRIYWKEVQLVIYSLDRSLVTSHTCASTLICIIVEAHSMETSKKKDITVSLQIYLLISSISVINFNV